MDTNTGLLLIYLTMLIIVLSFGVLDYLDRHNPQKKSL